MSIYKQFATDEKKEQDGIDITFDANDDGTIPTFRVKRMSSKNKPFLQSYTRRTKAYQRQIEAGTISPEKRTEINIDVFCDSGLTGWENVQGPTGETIQYNRDNAVRLFTQLPELFFELQGKATSLQAFQAEDTDADTKN